MAKTRFRINKLTAVILALVLVVLAGGVMFAIYRWGPKDPQPYIEMGETAEQEGNFEVAISAYNRAYRLDAGNRAPWGIKAGDLHWLLGRTEQAGQFYRGVVKYEPNSVPGQQRLLQLFAWHAYSFGGEGNWVAVRDQADRLIELAGTLDLDNEVVKNGYTYGHEQAGVSRWFLDQAKFRAEALPLLEKLRELDPGNPAGYYYAALILGRPESDTDIAAGEGGLPRDVAAADALMQTMPADATPAVASRFRLYMAQYQLSAKNDINAARGLVADITDGSGMTRREQTIWANLAFEMARRRPSTQPEDLASPADEPDYTVTENIYKNWGNDIVASLAELSNPPVTPSVLRIAEQKQPMSLNGCVRLANLYLRTGRPEKAAEQVARGMAIPLPEEEEGLLARVMRSQRFDLSMTDIRRRLADAQRSGERDAYEEIRAALEEVARLYDAETLRSPDYHQLVGQTNYRLGRLAIAQIHLQKARDLLATRDSQQTAGSQLRVSMTLIEVYRRLRQFGDARQLLRSLSSLPTTRDMQTRLRLVESQLLADTREYGAALQAVEQVLSAIGAEDAGEPADIEDEPLLARALRLKAEILTATNRQAEANEIYVRLEGADAPSVLVRQGIVLRNEQKYVEALQKFQAALAKDPNMWAAALLSASCYNSLEKKDQAIALLRGFKESNPENQEVDIALVVLEQGSEEAAEKLRELQAKLQEERRTPTQQALYDAQKAAAESAEPDASPDASSRARQEIRAHLANALKLAGGDRDEVLRTHLVGFDLGLRLKDWDLARTHLRALENADADGLNGLSYKARLNFAQRDWVNAERDFREIIAKRRADANTHVLLARTLIESGKSSQDAESLLRRAIEQNPLHAGAWRLLVQLLLSERRQNEAWAKAEEGLARIGSDPVLEGVRLQQWAADNQTRPQAIAYRERLYERSPDNLSNIVALAGLYYQQGEPDKAERLLVEGLEKAPEENKLAMVQMISDFYRRNNQIAKGERMLFDYREAHPDDPNVSWSLSNYYRILDRFDESLRMLDEALAKAEKIAQPDRRQAMQARLHLAKADTYVQANKPDAAIAAVISAQDIYDEPVDAVQRRLITLLTDFRRLDEAERAIADYKKRWPDDINGDLYQGRLMMRRGKWAEAVEAFDRILAANGSAALAHYLKAQALYQADPQGNREAAIEGLQKALQYDPNLANGDPRMLLAQLYREANQPSNAIRVYRDLLEQNPTRHQARLQLIRIYHERRRSRDVQSALDEAMRLYGDVPLFHVLAGTIAAEGKQWVAAEADFRKARELAPLTVEPLVALCQALGEQNKWQAVIQETDGWLKREETAQAPPQARASVLARQAVAWGKLRRKDKMSESLARAVEAAGESFSVLGTLARLIREELGDQEALAWLDEYVSADPQAIEPRRIRAEFWAGSDRVDEAIGDLERLLASAETDQLKAVLHADLARIRQQSGRFAAAAKDFEKVLELTGTRVTGNAATDRINVRFDVLNNYAYLLADNLDRASEAIPYAQKAVELRARDPNILDTLGWCYVKTGDEEKVKQGIDILDEARQKQPLPVVYYHLARAYQQLGQPDNARSMAREAVDRADDQDPVKKQAQELLDSLAGN